MPRLPHLLAGQPRSLRPASIRAVPLVVVGALVTLLPLGCGESNRADSVADADTSSSSDVSSTSAGDSTSTTAGGGSGNSGDSGDTTTAGSSTSSGGSGDGGSTSGDASTSSDGSGGSGGDASSSSDGSGGSGGDVAVCENLPASGDSCEEGVQCQVAGSPCGSIFTCSEGKWQQEVVCPKDPECPAEAPSKSDACALTNPAAGVQVCLYDEGCGQVQADCDGTSWTVRVTPASTACADLCEDLCTRLLECGVSWAESCMSDCSTAYACPGETVGQDAAICEGRQTELSELGCGELCEAVTDTQASRHFGEGCDEL